MILSVHVCLKLYIYICTYNFILIIVQKQKYVHMYYINVLNIYYDDIWGI